MLKEMKSDFKRIKFPKKKDSFKDAIFSLVTSALISVVVTMLGTGVTFLVNLVI